MADSTSTIRINVAVEGGEQINRIADAFRRIGAQNQRVAAPTILARPFASLLQTGGVSDQAAQRIGAIMGETVAGPMRVVGNMAGRSVGAVTSILGPLARAGVAVVGGTGTAVAAGAAFVAIAIPLAKLALTYKLMRSSFGWAVDASDDQLKVTARTRRTWPGLVDEAFNAQKERVESKIAFGAALFGESADSMMQGLTLRINRGLVQGQRGGANRNLFARWGITPENIRAFEEAQGGTEGPQRLGITDWLQIFIQRRERLDAEILASPEGSARQRALVQKRTDLLNLSFRMFNQKFADIASVMSQEDFQRYDTNIQASRKLASTTRDTRQNSADLKVELATTHEIFKNLKRGISNDVSPKITKMMDEVNVWFLGVEGAAPGVGIPLRQFISDVAIHGWETMSILIRDYVKPDEIAKFTKTVSEWKPDKTIKALADAVPSIEQLGHLIDNLATVARWLSKIHGAAGWLGLGPLISPIGAAAGAAAELGPVWRGERQATTPGARAGATIRRFLGLGPAAQVPAARQPAGGGGGVRGALDRMLGRGTAARGAQGSGSESRASRSAGPAFVPDSGSEERAGTVTSNPPSPGGGKLSGNQILEIASQRLGMHEIRDRRKLQEFMQSQGYNVDPKQTAWCAAYVGSVIKAAGGQPTTGPSRLTASSYLKWGQGIARENVQAGDVLISNPRGVAPGQPGAHVGVATGRTKGSGRNLQIEMLGGNQRDMVRADFMPAGRLTVRRGVGTTVVAGAGQTQTTGIAPANGAPPPAPPPADTGVAATTPGGRGRGTIDRSAYAAELQRNPQLREKILRIMANEQGKHPQGTQAVAESLFNRAQVRSHSLNQVARWTGRKREPGGYYDYGRGDKPITDPAHRAVLEKSLDAALGGSNISNYATDNASSWLARKRIKQGNIPTAVHGGETFFTPPLDQKGNIKRYKAWRQALGPAKKEEAKEKTIAQAENRPLGDNVAKSKQTKEEDEQKKKALEDEEEKKKKKKAEEKRRGGPVRAGKVYRVGEQGPEQLHSVNGRTTTVGARGPELIRPTTAGNIEANKSNDNPKGDIDPVILREAKKIALEQGPHGTAKYLNAVGINRDAAWCGAFAAGAVREAGGIPPKNPAVASNWRNFGEKVTGAPQPGDIAVKMMARSERDVPAAQRGKYVPTGAAGSHVTIVDEYNPKTGVFKSFGGNQGQISGQEGAKGMRYKLIKGNKWDREYKSKDFEFFRAQSEQARKELTEAPPKHDKEAREGAAFGRAGAEAFMKGIEDVTIPIKSVGEEENNRRINRQRKMQALRDAGSAEPGEAA